MLKRPGVIGLGLLAQVVLLPLTALAIVTTLGLGAELAVGLMILAACPGGVTALSISLTALTSLLSFVSVPLIVGASLGHFLGGSTQVQLPVAQVVGGLLLITLLPVVIGLTLRERDLVTASMRRRVHLLATGTFVLIVLHTFVDQWDAVTGHFAAIGAACLLLNLLTMTTGGLLGAAVRLPVRGRIALAMECGMQNSALGITLAISVLALPELAIPSVIYALLMNVTAFVFIALRTRLGNVT